MTPPSLFRVDDTRRENYVLFNSVQQFVKIEARLLLIFFPCLQKQLISIHSIVTFYSNGSSAGKMTLRNDNFYYKILSRKLSLTPLTFFQPGLRGNVKFVIISVNTCGHVANGKTFPQSCFTPNEGVCIPLRGNWDSILFISSQLLTRYAMFTLHLNWIIIFNDVFEIDKILEFVFNLVNKN